MEVKLQNVTVNVKDQLTWGDTQKIQSALMGGAKMSGKAQSAQDIGFDFDATAMLEAKYVALECAVIDIKVGEKTKQFSREWMDNLTQDDGDKLMEVVEGLQKKDEGTPSN